MADDVFGDEEADRVSGAGPMDIMDVVQDWVSDPGGGGIDNFSSTGISACAPFVGERLCFLLIDRTVTAVMCWGGWRGRTRGPAGWESRRLTGTIAWMRLGRPTPAGVGVRISAMTSVVGASDALHGDEELVLWRW